MSVVTPVSKPRRQVAPTEAANASKDGSTTAATITNSMNQIRGRANTGDAKPHATTGTSRAGDQGTHPGGLWKRRQALSRRAETQRLPFLRDAIAT